MVSGIPERLYFLTLLTASGPHLNIWYSYLGSFDAEDTLFFVP